MRQIEVRLGSSHGGGPQVKVHFDYKTTFSNRLNRRPIAPPRRPCGSSVTDGRSSGGVSPFLLPMRPPSERAR